MVIPSTGEKLRGEWHLLRTTAANGRRAAQGDMAASGPKSQWLLIKLDHAAADPKLDIVVTRPESVLTGQIETRGPTPAFRGGGAGIKPDMPVLLSTGVLGAGRDGTTPYKSGSPAPKGPARTPTPLFTRISLEDLQVDLADPQGLLDLPEHLFSEAGAPAGPIAELLLLLERKGAPARDKTLGSVAEVALVMFDLFARLGLHALACVAGPRALLVRVPIAPAPAKGALERFADRLAKTLSAQLAPIREGRVSLERSLQKKGAAVPALLEKIAASPKLICAPLAWDEVAPELVCAKFTADWLAKHGDAAQERASAYLASAAPLPRAR